MGGKVGLNGCMSLNAGNQEKHFTLEYALICDVLKGHLDGVQRSLLFIYKFAWNSGVVF